MSEAPSGIPPDERPNGLRRRLAAALGGRRSRRDGIAAEIGQGASGVAVGKNIIQIGTFIIPTLPVAALLVVALAGLGLAGWRLLFPPRGPVTMDHVFNVALADFAEEDTQGHVRRSAAGDRLSLWVYQAFEAQKNRYPDL